MIAKDPAHIFFNQNLYQLIQLFNPFDARAVPPLTEYVKDNIEGISGFVI
jgi:hypothetical protein